MTIEDTMPDARVFVTGATGHTGRRLVRRLLADGRRVRILTRRPERAREYFAAMAVEAIVEGDLTDPKPWGGALRECAALISVSHLRHVHQLIPACEAAQVGRAIFLSSARRYTRFPDGPADEVRAGEERLAQSALNYTIFRPTMIFGAEDDRNLAGLLKLVRRWPIIPMPGGGRNRVQPTFVLDLVDVMARHVFAPGTYRKAYDIGGAEAMAYGVMLRRMADALNRHRWILPIPLGPVAFAIRALEALGRRPAVTSDQIQRLLEDKTVDITAAIEELGYRPTPFDEALAMKIAGRV